MKLIHGTTRMRAEQIALHGPAPQFREPGGYPADDGFSMTVETGPFLFGTPSEYAIGKAAQFPTKGGPVILVVDVPDDIISNAATEWFPLGQGLVQFDRGAGLEMLLEAWPDLWKEIRSIP